MITDKPKNACLMFLFYFSENFRAINGTLLAKNQPQNSSTETVGELVNSQPTLCGGAYIDTYQCYTVQIINQMLCAQVFLRLSSIIM